MAESNSTYARSPNTVYPSKADAFPAATFFDAESESSYIRHVQKNYQGRFGICICPARSFWKHQVDVTHRQVAEPSHNPSLSR